MIQSKIIENENDIQLNLIDQSVKQQDLCCDIGFNSSGTIMVSTNGLNIDVWSFKNGQINLLNSLKGHTNYVNCLLYSKKQEAFLSGSGDKTIRIWNLNEQNIEIRSSSFPSNSGYVFCLLLNSNEDQLYSGNEDKSIKIWQIDFDKNHLNFLYSLEKHEKYVNDLSLNQSESTLVSSADGYDQIIIWQRGSQNQMVFKYIVIIDEIQIANFNSFEINQMIIIQILFPNIMQFIRRNKNIVEQFFYNQSIYNYGRKVKFIKEDQFIWVTASNTEIAKIYVFELKNGVFEENSQKTIELISTNYIYDEKQFPIVYIKEKNLMLVRHKNHIYLIREMTNGKFKIAEQLDCEENYTVGTITNNGSHLVFWSILNKSYSIYELQYK